MTAWRMSFKAGNRGPSMREKCLTYEVAAITYRALANVDLSKYSPGEPKESWKQLAPSQKVSLRRVAYEMKKGDVIYVKDGPKIVNKGLVQESYHFDSEHRIIDPNGTPWSHQVPVKWLADFPEIEGILLGAEQYAVLKLTTEQVKSIEGGLKKTKATIDKQEAIEGQIYTKEVLFRKRNRALIEVKKANSKYRCEVCNFSFEETYGFKYIVAHHLIPIASQSKPTKTTSDDIALLCANCHAMVHTKNPPLSLDEMRQLINRKYKS